MSRYDGLIIPRSYSEYINKTDAATLQQALQLSGVLSGAVAAGDNKAVKSSAVNDALTEFYIKKNLNRVRERRVGEIYNSNEYWKVTMIGYYARPIIFKCIGSAGLYDIAMFGQDCTPKLIRLGNESSQVYYKYTRPKENNTVGILYMKSNKINITHTIFSIDIYDGGLIGTLESCTKEEYDNATAF